MSDEQSLFLCVFLQNKEIQTQCICIYFVVPGLQKAGEKNPKLWFSHEISSCYAIYKFNYKPTEVGRRFTLSIFLLSDN